MNAIQLLLNSLQDDAPIQDIRTCLHWTAVISRRCGLAATLHNRRAHEHGSDPVREAGRLHLKTARQLADYALSDNVSEASLGVAAINSLIEPDLRHAVDLNAADVIRQHGRGKRVAVIGHFPFIGRLRAEGLNIQVLELEPAAGDLPAESAPAIVPLADIVVITATTIINHTFDDLLGLCSPHALVMVIGPSTPLSAVLFDLGVHILAGTVVMDAEAVLRSICQGATFQQVSGTRLVTIAPGKVW